MSHVDTLRLVVNDLASLGKAADRLGGVLEKADTYRWYGHHVGDYPVPEGFTVADLGRCEYRIRFPDAGYDVGVVRTPNGKGWTLLWDFWNDGYGLRAKIGPDGNKLREAYAIEATKAAYKRAGWRVNEVAPKRAGEATRLRIAK